MYVIPIIIGLGTIYILQPLSTDGATQTQEEEGDVGEEGDIDDDADMEELMQNREFLESVLSTLPGVNPEEALQNLQQMAQAQQEQQREGEEEGDGEVRNVCSSLVCTSVT